MALSALQQSLIDLAMLHCSLRIRRNYFVLDLRADLKIKRKYIFLLEQSIPSYNFSVIRYNILFKENYVPTKKKGNLNKKGKSRLMHRQSKTFPHLEDDAAVE